VGRFRAACAKFLNSRQKLLFVFGDPRQRPAKRQPMAGDIIGDLPRTKSTNLLILSKLFIINVLMKTSRDDVDETSSTAEVFPKDLRDDYQEQRRVYRCSMHKY
jgi:hypothetical protein